MNVQEESPGQVESIAIQDIHILNPRSRSKRLHRELIENIRIVGLKRPVTVSRRQGEEREPYDLVCGQGRLEALQALGYTTVPAIVVDVTEEDCLVMSLVENVARRAHPGIDLMREVGRLHERGHSDAEIGNIIGVSASYVGMIVTLLEKGEEKLLAAVEGDLIPLSMATDIAKSSSAEIQNMLADAYDQGFRGRKLSRLRRLLEVRAKRSPKIPSAERPSQRAERKPMTAAEIRRIFGREAERQKLLIKKASFVHDRLVFSTQAIKELAENVEFSSLLKAEGLDTLPKLIQDRVRGA
jgi:ParB family transcriptional regulator, chromosome partitioning protein